MTVRLKQQGAAPAAAPTLACTPLVRCLFACWGLGIAASPAHADPGVTDLGVLAGTYSFAYGINASGNVVVGDSRVAGGSTHAIRWTAATGMVDLGTLGGTDSHAYGVNAVGDVAVGESTIASGTFQAFRWTAATGMVNLGTFGGRSSVANGVNAAGDVVVGYATLTGNTAAHAFRWTQATGMVDLGTLGGTNSFAYGVNAVGDVVVGYAYLAGNTATHAFRWTQATGMVDLGTLSGTNSIAFSVNAAGDVIVGYATLAGNLVTHAFRWTQATGMVDLGTLGGTDSHAHGVNAAGDIVVGTSYIASGANRAFRWTQATGMQTIEDWLTANGVKVNATAAKTKDAYGVNAAGDVIVGRLDNNRAFIATTKGLIDTVEFNRSLAGTAASSVLGLPEAGMVLHGAHGNPMRGRPAAGRSSLWAAGDLGSGTSSGQAGSAGAAELGYARGLSDGVTAKLAFGRTYSQQDSLFGGSTRTTGTYVLPEMMARIGETRWHATLSGYYNWGDADIRRGYDNAGTREYGHGSAGTETGAVRARVDWLNAAQVFNMDLTPFASITYARTTLGAYRESSGSFPARWEQRVEDATDVKLGLDAVYPLADGLNVLGRVEATHRVDKEGAGASGEVVGLYGFNLQGQAYKRDWVRTSLGVEGKMGVGTGSLMLNASSQSSTAQYWLAASYRVDF